MSDVKNRINNILLKKIEKNYYNDKEFTDSLHVLLNGNFIKYNFEDTELTLSSPEEVDFQYTLFKLNEKSDKQKKNGVYYTPNDVSEYIIVNSLINYVNDKIDKTIKYNDIYKELYNNKKSDLEKLLFNSKIFDPTCGSGEFLLNTFIIKYNLLKEKNIVSDDNILKITNTLYGNDIDDESTDISKIRLFFYIVNLLNERRYFKKLSKILVNNFSNYDFVSDSFKIDKKFDIIIGNPPYVEYSKYEYKEKLNNKFGNIYADVIKNSLDLLNKNGVLGFIIPLSYISTTRMSKIRTYVDEKCSKQIILSFADRPDCLFNGVHQKLNIVIFKKNKSKREVYVSNYKHWYCNERKDLLNGCDVLISDYNLKFLPKIGNEIEKRIFDKIYTTFDNNLYNSQNNETKKLYLNMRCCFWIKAFSFNPGSNEYKTFSYNNNDYAICLFNSTLFWLFWTIVSDCWHITSKELKHFKYLETNEDFSVLRKDLENKLENTKKYVGSKQTEFEYKHKYCKDVIDKIDDKLAILYHLTDEELNYIKNFALKYRMGGLEYEN